jgi:hypothetical protein
MKTEYNIKDQVWIHLGEQSLVQGRVVEIITLDHLNENHIKGHELYVIELKTGIDDIYEVRNFDQISPDAKGPIMCYRNMDMKLAGRYLKKIGITIPANAHVSNTDNPIDFPTEDEPTPEQIHAAIERAEQAKNQPFNVRPAGKRPAKKRTFTKRKKADVGNT